MPGVRIGSRSIDTMRDDLRSKKCCVPQTSGKTSIREKPPALRQYGTIQADLINLDGGWFQMGANDGPHPQDGEGPSRKVFVDGFSLAATTVTIGEFREFVKSTGYKTLAERLGYSFVFSAFLNSPEKHPPSEQAPWWRQVSGACWYSPYGTQNKSGGIADHPVTHVSFEDALAFCKWSQTRLPSEAEWEFAARGGLEAQPYPWGDALAPGGQYRANVWQGQFPDHNTGDDGYAGTAPVSTYPPNGFGFYNMTGNVWEWTMDRFTNLHSPRPVRNPIGPLNGNARVGKGGSYLCHSSYCFRYRTSSRQALLPDTVAGNIGFRVASARLS